MDRQSTDARTDAETDAVDSPCRRRLLVGMSGALAATSGIGIGQVAGQDERVTVTIDNVGASAWEVTSVQGDGDVAPMGEENPTLSLQVGTRYTFENEGWGFHPLAFRDANDDALLTQDGSGRFEEDSTVDWTDDGDTLAFTLTEGLAAELDDYICTVHSLMNGSIETVERPEPAAAVTFSEQTTDGTTITVDSVRMDDGGFVTMHDSTLLDGDALGSVVGVSEYLGPGSAENVTVELDEQLTEDQTLIAMPHRDTNGNQSYDFVESEGGADAPYTADGGAVTDAAEVTVEQPEPAAAVTFSGQTTDGTTVTVDSVRMDDGGFVTMHDSTLLDGDALGSVVGVSEYREPGTYENISVELDEQLAEDQTLIAMPHRDTNGNQSYDFVESGGGTDAPYTADGGAVTDDAEVTVEQPEPAASVTFSEQTTDGTTVTVDSVRVDDGGFVTMHDSTLLDGDALGSVVGVSEYLEPGSAEGVSVELDEQLAEDQTLIAMPHRDTNGNERYEFVESNGSQDGPYTADGSAVIDDAEVTVERTAAVTFSEQTTDGTVVTVDSVRMEAGGFVTIHDETLLEGDALGSVVGVSGYLE
jgi:plastocyanin